MWLRVGFKKKSLESQNENGSRNFENHILFKVRGLGFFSQICSNPSFPLALVENEVGKFLIKIMFIEISEVVCLIAF